MATVFVSHSSSDQAYAEEFASELRKYGHQPVGDIQSLRTSADWDSALLAAFATADVAVFLFTKNATGSENILAEVGAGKILYNRFQKPHLIPIVFPGGSLPFPLSRAWAQMLQARKRQSNSACL